MMIKISEIAKGIAEKALDEYLYKGKTIRQWVDEILKSDWIPVKKQLPEYEEDVLLQLENGVMVVGFLEMRDSKNTYWQNNVDEDYCTDLVNDPVAWKPLPDSYEPQEESEWKEAVMRHFTRVE